MSFKNPFKQNPREFLNNFAEKQKRNPFKNDGPYEHKEHFNKFSKHQKNPKDFEKSTKEREWGQKKFNPLANKPLYEGPATPWSTFKHELLQKQQDNKRSADALDMESIEAKKSLKLRDKNYRRSLIVNEVQKATAVKWETFEDTDNEDNQVESASIPTKKHKKHKTDKQKQKYEDEDDVAIETIKVNNAKITKPKKQQHQQQKHQQHQQQKQQKYQEQKQQLPKSPYITKEQLKNFDSKNLTFEQNNHFRKIITKTTCLMKGNKNLEDIVKDMKRHGVKRKYQNSN